MNWLMAANWKMYKTPAEAEQMLEAFLPQMQLLPPNREVAFFPPAPALCVCHQLLQGQTRIFLGGQNCYPADEGAFTGEISPAMLKASGCRFVLAGHSERRSLFGESDTFVGEKVGHALASGLDVILCVGESLAEREANQLATVLERQIRLGVAHIPQSMAPHRISIAYEPVWAIGTGKVAGPAEIQEAHFLVRENLHTHFREISNNIRILYGGSVKPENAGAIITLDNVNGVLVGGASLLAENFSRIVLA